MDLSSPEFAEAYTTRTALGAHWGRTSSTFRVWAPEARAVLVCLYEGPFGGTSLRQVPLELGARGVWQAVVEGDLAGLYYTVATEYPLRGWAEGVDPYARSVGVQGLRGYLFDPSTTHPEGWSQDRSPPLAHQLDSVLYELSVRDATSLPSSGVVHRGKFLGLAERGTRSPEGLATGLDHLVELGVTHVHLLPVFDFDGVDDLNTSPTDYNWGYNPRNFNALKLSFSTDPRDPALAIREFKTLVAALHAAGLRVVLDVVYNHTFASADSNLNKVFPDYYYRLYGSTFSNGSGCGNELATERSMVRRYILDSLHHWRSEYHLDGFRFDLMGLYDLDTMNEIARELRRDDPNLLLYGEGWTGGLSTLPESRRAIKANAPAVREVAFFSDENRDTLKGHVFEVKLKGFANGGSGLEAQVQFAVTGCTDRHPNLGRGSWAQGPHQVVNYVAAHDNHTLWDKLAHTNPSATVAQRVAMAKLAHAAVFLSQGLPFLHAGEEFLRSKQGVENSYQSPDAINGLDWSAKARHRAEFDYVRGLIAVRRAHPALRLRSADRIREHLRFPSVNRPGVVQWTLVDHAGNDAAEQVMVVLNSTTKPQEVLLPEGHWTIIVDADHAGLEPLGEPVGGVVEVAPVSAMVLITT